MAASTASKKRYATLLILALLAATAGTAVYVSQKDGGEQFFKKNIIYAPQQPVSQPLQQQPSENGYYYVPSQTSGGGGSGQSQQGGGQQQPQPPQQAQCTDSDNGLNKNIQGTCKDGTTTITDGCQGNALIEFQCAGSACQQNLLFCPAGTVCANGACVAQKEICPAQTPSCLTAQDALAKGCAQQSNNCGSDSGIPKFCWACPEDKCQAGQTVCNNICTNTKTDISNCGGCNSKCDYLPEHGSQIICSNGECDFTCQAGYEKEANLQSPFYNTCVKKESTFCTDSDFGKDTHRAGTCTEDYFSYSDRCGTDSVVEEYTCIDDQCSSQPVFCATGERCEGGVCIPRCADTDGGYVLGTRGTCTSAAGTFTDTCAQSQAGRSELLEYSCSDAGAACLQTQASCPEGQFCENGACKPTPPPGGGGVIQFCTDTDNGIDTSTAGSCSSGGNNYYDTCFSAGSVAEYFCSNSACTFDVVQCPQGQQCTGNKCEPVTMPQYPYPY